MPASGLAGWLGEAAGELLGGAPVPGWLLAGGASAGLGCDPGPPPHPAASQARLMATATAAVRWLTLTLELLRVLAAPTGRAQRGHFIENIFAS
jgi:hypothetical protein